MGRRVRRRRGFPQGLMFCLMAGLCLAPGTARAGRAKREPEKPDYRAALTSPDAIAATTRLREAFSDLLGKYHESLGRSREHAARKGDAQEAARIDNALKLEPEKGYTSAMARAARNRFEAGLRTALRTYVREMKLAVKDALVAADTGESMRIDAAINKAEALLNSTVGRTVTMRLYAVKDWQKAGIELKKRAVVNILAEGRWSPGLKRRKAKKKYVHIYGDADTYNMQARVGARGVGRGGAKWQFAAPRDGPLLLRLGHYRGQWRRANARGHLNLRITVTSPEGTDPETDLETVIRNLLEGGDAEGYADDKQGAFKKVTLTSKHRWQDTDVMLRKGATVFIRAIGKPDDDKKKRRKKFPEGADPRRIHARVGEVSVGHSRLEWRFKAPKDGKLYLLLSNYPDKKRRSAGDDLVVHIWVRRPHWP